VGGVAAGARLLDEGAEPSDVAPAMNDRVDRRRHASSEILLGARDVEDAFVGADAERMRAAFLAQRREGHAARHRARGPAPRERDAAGLERGAAGDQRGPGEAGSS